MRIWLCASREECPPLAEETETEKKEMLILTASPEVCAWAKQQHVCCIGLEREDLRLPDAWCSMLPPFEMDPVWLEMQLCHFHDRPFVLYAEGDGRLVSRKRNKEPEENSRMRIRECIEADHPSICELLQRTSMQVEGIAERSTFRAYTTDLYRMWGFGMWAVELQTAAGAWKMAGWCGLFPTQLPCGGIELGYVIDPAEQGKGIGYEACRRILDFARNHLGMEAPCIQAPEQNTASRKLAVKLGLIPIGS